MMRLAWLALLLVLTGCDGPAGDDATVYKETQYVFGTLVEFTIRGVPEERAREAVAAVGQDFQRMHRDWHAWKPPGELYRLNQAFAGGEAMEVSPFLLPLIVQAKAFHRLSDGHFNPAIGALIDAWGFHADELPTGSLPSFERIAALAAGRPSMDDVVIEDGVVSSRNRAVRLDFGGFGKGAALDVAVGRLREFGIENAIVNAGGDLNTIGRAQDRPWRVGIRHPVGWGVIGAVELGDGENLYTSGNYERFREQDGIRYAHILDPRDGMPVRHIVSASVIAADGALADAAATALTVAGPRDWRRIAERMGIRFALLVDDEGTVHASAAMAERVSFEPAQPTRLVIGDSP